MFRDERLFFLISKSKRFWMFSLQLKRIELTMTKFRFVISLLEQVTYQQLVDEMSPEKSISFLTF